MSDNHKSLHRAAQLLDGAPVDQTAIHEAVTALLLALGEDAQREGLQRTPERVARMYVELTAGYRTDPVTLVNDALFSAPNDEMIVVRDIEFYSLCEHHLLPFVGRAQVAYLPGEQIIGLSKIPRIVEMYARRLQVQERMTQQIADFLDEALHPRGVAVMVEASHLCALMRGVKQHEAHMVTMTTRGAFRSNPAMRAEFLQIVSRPATF